MSARPSLTRVNEPGSITERAGDVAVMIQQQLENSEELFRVSLLAKNDEISQLNDEVRTNRLELSAEVKYSHTINDELIVALEAIDKKEHSIDQLKIKNKELTAKLDKLNNRIKGCNYQPNEDDIKQVMDESPHKNLSSILQEKLLLLQKELDGKIALVDSLKLLYQREVEEREAEVTTLQERERLLTSEVQAKTQAVIISEKTIELLKGELEAKNEAMRAAKELEATLNGH